MRLRWTDAKDETIEAETAAEMAAAEAVEKIAVLTVAVMIAIWATAAKRA